MHLVTFICVKIYFLKKVDRTKSRPNKQQTRRQPFKIIAKSWLIVLFVKIWWPSKVYMARERAHFLVLTKVCRCMYIVHTYDFNMSPSCKTLEIFKILWSMCDHRIHKRVKKIIFGLKFFMAKHPLCNGFIKWSASKALQNFEKSSQMAKI